MVMILVRKRSAVMRGPLKFLPKPFAKLKIVILTLYRES